MPQPNKLREDDFILSFRVRWKKMCEKNNIHTRMKIAGRIRINQGFNLKGPHSEEKAILEFPPCLQGEGYSIFA
jgi:hypothetical protein